MRLDCVVSFGGSACVVLCGTHVVYGWLWMEMFVHVCSYIGLLNSGDAIHADYNRMGHPAGVLGSGPVHIHK